MDIICKTLGRFNSATSTRGRFPGGEASNRCEPKEYAVYPAILDFKTQYPQLPEIWKYDQLLSRYLSATFRKNLTKLKAGFKTTGDGDHRPEVGRRRFGRNGAPRVQDEPGHVGEDLK